MAFPIVALALPLAVALTGCGKSQWPEVSAENCKPVNVLRIEDPSWRADFMQFCQSIPSTAWPIQPQAWLALPHAKRAIFFDEAAVAPRFGTTPSPLNWLSVKP